MINVSPDEGVCLPPVSPFPKGSIKQERLDALKDMFILKYNMEPDIYIRMPGRVNLIGEHIDYCGYSVCPMAIEQDILLAAKATDSGPFLQVANVDEKYADYTIPRDDFKISHEEYNWCAYVLCGVRGGLNRCEGRPCSLRFVIGGTIPPASGLSSSSALVSASLLATTYLNKLRLSKTELAAMSAEAERYIGTAGGGMDQAIAFCASEGCAKHIKFSPVRCTDVSLPSDAIFVIAHSLVTKEKATSNDFNTRVVETRIAARILGKNGNVQLTNNPTIADIQSELDVSLDKMISLVEATFHKHPYTKSEVCEELNMSEKEFEGLLTKDTQKVSKLELYKRALHVVTEAQRVEDWLSAGNLLALGDLLNQSHASLRDLYEASHPALDRLTSHCLSAGALGARLTGAGWGGSVVALVPSHAIDSFISSLKQTFYKDSTKDINRLVFPSRAGSGAQIFISN